MAIIADRVQPALAALSLLALLIAGCGGAPPTEATPPATPAEASAPVAEAAPSSEPPQIEIPPDVPVEPIQVSEDFSPAEATGGVQGIPAATNTAPIVAIANFYADLPGFDMTSLKPSQREKFLQRANSELCTCGCKNDTLAKCFVNDKSCPMVRDLLTKVLNEVRAGP